MLEKFNINTDEEKNYQEINKIMNDAINVTKQYKNKDADDLKEEVINIIKKSKYDPLSLKNQDKENLAHLIVKLDKVERVEIIIQSYIDLLGLSDDFFAWLLSENKDNETPLDLCAKLGIKKVITYMYSIIIKTN